MNTGEFFNVIEAEHNASLDMLKRKGAEYASGVDRLSNFKQAAGLRDTNPIDALVGMVVKHWTSISDMAKNPTAYSMDMWDEKLRDNRNYTYLMKGLLLEMYKKED